ncbi:MAG: mechanosensitive ion channel family protein [Planctomycetota bacterium]|nr:mechanosensitive ion channel family protein [Planctomycetota bacterium]
MTEANTPLQISADGWQPWLIPWAVLLGAIALGVALHLLLFFIARRVLARTGRPIASQAVQRLSRPAGFILPAAAVIFALPAAGFTPRAETLLRQASALVLILGSTWLVIRAVSITSRELAGRQAGAAADSRHARQLQTQISILSKSAVIIVGVVGLAAALMTFPNVRQVGASVLASAGLAGIIIGLAARPVVSNLIAGIQLVFTRPVALDDVVIVQGEWGRVEEFTQTFVVVRIWDDRRMIVPLTWFIENPFQNWSRQGAALLGEVKLYTDYQTPVNAVRAEAERVIRADPDWDGRVRAVQVTDALRDTIQLRVLMSAADSSKLFDLHCRVREALIDFLKREHPEALPRSRAEVFELAETHTSNGQAAALTAPPRATDAS